MWDLKACIVCFTSSGKLISLNLGDARQKFNLVSGFKTRCNNGMPDYLCIECLAYVKKFVKFREKCQRAHFTLQCLLQSNKEIDKNDLKIINCKNLNITPSLSFVDLNKIHYEQVEFQWNKDCLSRYIPEEVIPISHYGTLTSEDTFECTMKDVSQEHENPVKFEVGTNNEEKPYLDIENEVVIQPQAAELDVKEVIIDNDNTDVDNAVYLEDTSDHKYEDDFEEELDYIGPNNKADGSVIDERYANLIPISVKEAKAAAEVKKMFMAGKFKCDCGWSTNKEEMLATHKRMHDKHISGNFHCDICDYYYKTDFLLQTHMSIQHMYKYVCRICCEVHFDRPSAKHHYVKLHNGVKLIRKRRIKNWHTGYAKGYNKGVKRVPEKFLKSIPIKPNEQYEMIELRKQSKNYLEANYRCEMCYRGFRLLCTYERHMVKHDSSVSGKIQCDMCKLFFPDTRKLYKHMNMNHLTNYMCKLCKFTTTNRTQAMNHYRWHKNVTYDCPHCDRKFLKLSTRLTHIRLKHPSTCMCNICGHSFVSLLGLKMHRRMHSKKERDDSKALAQTDEKNFFCAECDIQFLNEQAYVTHLTSSSKHVHVNLASIKTEQARAVSERSRSGLGPARGRRPRAARSDVLNTGLSTTTHCEICETTLSNDVQVRKHYESEHPGADYLKRYMCDVCGHTTKQYANLLAHMRTHTNEKPYQCTFCDRRFSMPSNRDRHLVVHTGEKRFECQHCSRRFTQSSAVKLHIQTVHMKIPYAPWDKKKRKRRKEMEPTTAEVNIVAPQGPCVITQPQPKLIIENQEYISAYIYDNE